MKKIWNLVIGGIENKIFNLFLITFVLVMSSYIGLIVYQSKELSTIVRDTGEKQVSAITAITDETMHTVVSTNMANDTELQASQFDSTFRVLRSEVSILRDFAELILADPSAYDSVRLSAPDPAKEGEAAAQLIYESEELESDRAAVSSAGLMGNMAGMMESMFNTFDEIDSCYVATAEGAFIIVDDNSAGKFDSAGNLIHIPARERPWYKGAAERGDLYFSDVQNDIFTGRIGIDCSVPVYGPDGRLAAVIGADLFLDTLAETVDASTEYGGMMFIVNQDGHVIFSPEKEGIFAVSENGEDLRQEGGELASFISEAFQKKTDVRLVNVSGTSYYMAGCPLETVGWTAVSAVDKTLIDQPSQMISEQYRNISADASKAYAEKISSSRKWSIGTILTLFVLGIISTLILGKRIVRPLTRMTKEIGSLGGDHLQFRMKDIYKTNDEIEVLAESFADLSAKTLRYVEEVKNVTAEKERIGAEMNMATDIQASQLPSTFPPYPEREEFSIYASMQPAKEVGGDFYDFFLIDSEHLGMVMADVSGKGVPAALFMMIAKILIKNRLQSGESPGAALENVNRQLNEGNSADMFVTVWCAVLDLATGQGVAANAGHEHPAVRRKNGEYELIRYRHSPAVAMIDDVPFREHGFRLNPGDSLFVYTDGVPEATNKDLELFGTDRMLDALNTEPDATPEKTVFNVMKGINAFVAGNQQFDDITMLALTYNGPREENKD